MDLVLVAEENDILSADLSRLATSRGLRAEILSPAAAARLFSIRFDGLASFVEPDLPMFVRPRGPDLVRESADAAFAAAEATAMLWGVGALLKSPCINRPGRRGFAGRTSASATLTKLRAGGAEPVPEVFSRDAPAPPTPDRAGWYVQDMASLETAVWPGPSTGVGPFRGRASRMSGGYEVVAVLGEKAWRSTTAPLSHLELDQRSVRAVHALDLRFAAITWEVSSTGEDASLVRVNPFPGYAELAYVWPELAPALLDALTG
jgi:hypothetical protein